jgi:hypothetical protein
MQISRKLGFRKNEIKVNKPQIGRITMYNTSRRGPSKKGKEQRDRHGEPEGRGRGGRQI